MNTSEVAVEAKIVPGGQKCQTVINYSKYRLPNGKTVILPNRYRYPSGLEYIKNSGIDSCGHPAIEWSETQGGFISDAGWVCAYHAGHGELPTVTLQEIVEAEEYWSKQAKQQDDCLQRTTSDLQAQLSEQSRAARNIIELCHEIGGLPIDYDLESQEVVMRYTSDITELDDDSDLEEYLNQRRAEL